MYKLAALLAVVAVASATSLQLDHMRTFNQWKRDFGKQYEDAAAETRAFENFKTRMDFINQHNEEFLQGKHTYKVSVNQFMDMSMEDFRSQYLRPYHSTAPRNEVYLPPANDDSVDWRSKGAVTPIKNQGQCGSCWSFSSTGSIEGAHQIATGNLVSLSEQQLVDCSVSYGNHGCEGGLMDYAFKYVKDNGGITTEQNYPYTAQNGQCKKDKAADHAATVSGYQDVPQNNEDQLAAAVAKGPVSVAIEADQMSFQQYSSGVFSGPCGTQLDHGVLVVGYTSEYWIVKNSWGESWGDQGYIMMKRGVSASGICGIAMQPSYPLAGSGPGPSPPPPPPGPSPPPPPPGPGGNYYDKPNGGQCAHPNEEAVTIEGLSGTFCSPSCKGVFKKCDYQVGSEVTAQQECVLEKAGSSQPQNCALICQPGADDAGCPNGATCQAIQGEGICLYPQA